MGWILSVWIGACAVPTESVAQTVPEAVHMAEPTNPFAALLEAPDGVADGFVSPLGKGWKQLGNEWTHAGEATILAAANGRLTVEANGDVGLHSVYYENSQRRESIVWMKGLHGSTPGLVQKGVTIGTAEVLSLSLTVDNNPVDAIPFFRAHPTLFVPQQEPV